MKTKQELINEFNELETKKQEIFSQQLILKGKIELLTEQEETKKK